MATMYIMRKIKCFLTLDVCKSIAGYLSFSVFFPQRGHSHHHLQRQSHLFFTWLAKYYQPSHSPISGLCWTLTFLAHKGQRPRKHIHKVG